MLGADAGEVTAVVQIAMLGNLPYTAVSDAVLAHPTMAEGLNYLFGSVFVAASEAERVSFAKTASNSVDDHPYWS